MRLELIQASDLLRRNTPESLAEAIRLLQQTVYSFSFKMCGHREDAEDTTQEVLFRSLKHLPRIQDPSALAAWLYTVTRNRCHRLRSVAAESSLHKLSLDDLMPDEAELKGLLLDGTPSPEGRFLQAEERHLLHQAVLGIPSPLRIVLVLHDMEELDTDQVAQILGIQQGTVRVRLHRARLALRKGISLLLSGAAPDVSGSSKTTAETKGRAKAKRPEECHELFANLSEYLDGRLKPETCDKIRAHIEACPACVAFLRDLRAAINRCRSMEVECDPSVRMRLQTMLTQEYLRMLGNSSSPPGIPSV
jgi:RNA polymerase sigma-70 factor, ECF subfamily